MKGTSTDPKEIRHWLEYLEKKIPTVCLLYGNMYDKMVTEM